MKTLISVVSAIFLLPNFLNAETVAPARQKQMLSMVATGDCAGVIREWDRGALQLQGEIPDLAFYVAESNLKQGHLERAEQMFSEVLKTPFDREESYHSLITIARRKGDSENIAKYTAALKKTQEAVRSAYREVTRTNSFALVAGEKENETLERAVRFYSSRGGFPGEAEGDAYAEVGRYRDAIMAYEYALAENVPLSERLRSPLAKRLYVKLQLAWDKNGQTLSTEGKPAADIDNAFKMARSYAAKTEILRQAASAGE